MQRIGDFYREKILSREKLREQDLPHAQGEIKIEKGLFNWKLIRGNRTLEFDSEEEARYCKVFMDVGLSEVMVPEDFEYLKSILPALEQLKAKHDKIIDKHLRGIISPKMKNEILGGAWDKLMWESKSREAKGNSKP